MVKYGELSVSLTNNCLTGFFGSYEIERGVGCGKMEKCMKHKKRSPKSGIDDVLNCWGGGGIDSIFARAYGAEGSGLALHFSQIASYSAMFFRIRSLMKRLSLICDIRNMTQLLCQKYKIQLAYIYRHKYNA